MPKKRALIQHDITTNLCFLLKGSCHKLGSPWEFSGNIGLCFPLWINGHPATGTEMYEHITIKGAITVKYTWGLPECHLGPFYVHCGLYAEITVSGSYNRAKGLTVGSSFSIGFSCGIGRGCDCSKEEGEAGYDADCSCLMSVDIRGTIAVSLGPCAPNHCGQPRGAFNWGTVLKGCVKVWVFEGCLTWTWNAQPIAVDCDWGKCPQAQCNNCGAMDAR